MKMKALSRKCVILSALIRILFTCTGICKAKDVRFSIQNSELSATEGSCAEIKCNVAAYLSEQNAKWFWMKDAEWDPVKGDYVKITYVYSKKMQDVSADFAGRVNYTGTGPPWYKGRTCSIQMCNLRTTDSGNYIFRFVGKGIFKYSTNPVQLTVRENKCPITFTGLPVVKEFHTMRLDCSTLSSCPSYPLIQGLPDSTRLENYTHNSWKTSRATFVATWQDHGKELRCQTPNNTDQHLVKKFNLTVEYGPKDVVATINPSIIREGQSATLTCSAKGHPAPTFHSFLDDTQLFSTKVQTRGRYHCVALNKHSTVKSQPVDLDVIYPPQVEIKNISPVSEAKEGDTMILECQVKKSNPMPFTYRWYKDKRKLDHSGSHYQKTIVQMDQGSYECAAHNTAGSSALSKYLFIHVQYGPTKPNIHPIQRDVEVGGNLEIYCDTTADPQPISYTWYRHTRSPHLNTSVPRLSTGASLYLSGIKRGDEACYTCSATNIIQTGEMSEEACVGVLYPPTNLQLLMDTVVQEHQRITISCTVESWPPSHLTLTVEQSSVELHPLNRQTNVLNYTFTATPAHTGTYTCSASNGRGSSQKKQQELVVRYAPRDVKFQGPAGLTGKENSGMTLLCSASAYPEASFTWWKVTPGAPELLRRNHTLAFDSLRASDSGQYKCWASNDIGTGESELAEVKVKYAPKLTVIFRAAEQQQPDGRRSVTLSCSSRCYPPGYYFWFKRAKDGAAGTAVQVSLHQNMTVYSDDPGYYHCKASNEMGERSSDFEPLFVEGTTGGLSNALRFSLLSLFIMIVLIMHLSSCVYRRRRSSFQSTGHNAMIMLREPALPGHSRDELSYEHLTPQQLHCQPDVA